MNSISDMPRQWTENEADTFAEALQRLKHVDNINTAYQQGYNDGYKAAEDKILHCMEVPTRAAAKLQEENTRLTDENRRLREALLRQSMDSYEYE